MNPIDGSRAFLPVRFAVLTLSDTRSLADDKSGAVLAERIEGAGHTLAARAILPDERDRIAEQLRAWVADPGIDAVLTTGGTGLTGRDVTVEAHRDVYEKEIEAFGTVFTIVSMKKIGTSAIQSRACAGVAGGTICSRPICSRCRAAPAPAATPGTRFWRRNSTIATGPAISSKSCPASTSICGAAETGRSWSAMAGTVGGAGQGGIAPPCPADPAACAASGRAGPNGCRRATARGHRAGALRARHRGTGCGERSWSETVCKAARHDPGWTRSGRPPIWSPTADPPPNPG
jgi:molybdenum cofactor biosynthesis protein B